MLEKYLCIEPSGELRWIQLERKPRYNAVYNGQEALSLKDLYPILTVTAVSRSELVFVISSLWLTSPAA